MNKLARLELIVEGSSGETLLIRPPRKKLLTIAGVMFAVEFVLLGLTINYLFAIITTPAMLVWAYLYYEFCRIWVSYKYSRFWLVTAPIVSAVLAMAVRAAIS